MPCSEWSTNYGGTTWLILFSAVAGKSLRRRGYEIEHTVHETRWDAHAKFGVI
jgi:hypothetical protein